MKINKIKLKLLFGLLVVMIVSSCSNSDDVPIDKKVTTLTMQACNIQELNTTFHISDKAVYSWSLISCPDSLFTLQSSASSGSASFSALTPGMYDILLKVTDNGQVYTDSFNISVIASDKTLSPYINKVLDFLPAPGQFTNALPKYADGDTKDKIIEQCNTALVGQEKGSLISLGGFGGAIVFNFDHTVLNVKGRRDFRVLGNAFFSAANPNPDAPKGGSCEPGIIMVGYDKNKNGKPDDDEWFEIAGSEYTNSKTIHNYQIVYHRPQKETADDSSNEGYVSIDNYIYWTDNKNVSGYIPKIIYHEQSYYPLWIKDDTMTFSGTRLPDNAIDESGSGTYWVQYCYGYGYVDNVPNTDIDSAIDIDWAVDKDGNKVHLPGIDFVKVYNGMNQFCGWLGETSTEVMGAVDLHLTNVNLPTNGK
jgi:hypothetical protein